MGLRGRTNLKDFHLSFVTTTCHKFIPLIEPVPVKKILLDSLNFCNKKYEASIVAYALMPEHIHLLLYFHEETKLIEYMRDFKKYTSTFIRKYWDEEQPEILERIRYENDGQTFKVWMDRFDDVILYTSKVCYTKLNYVNNNPKERGLCVNSLDYEFSSARFYDGIPDEKLRLLHLSELL